MILSGGLRLRAFRKESSRRLTVYPIGHVFPGMSLRVARTWFNQVLALGLEMELSVLSRKVMAGSSLGLGLVLK